MVKKAAADLISKFGHHVLANPRRTWAYAIIFNLIPFLGWMAGAVVGLVTLRSGVVAGTWAMLFALLPSVALAILGYTQFILIDCASGVVFVWLAAIILRKFGSWQQLLFFVIILASVGILIIHGFNPDIDQWWQKTYFDLVNEQIQNQPVSQAEELRRLLSVPPNELNAAVSMATGSFATVLIVFGLINLLIARWWESHLFNPGGLQVELLQIRLPLISALFFALCVVGVWLQWKIFNDLLPIVLIVFALAGISLVYFLVLELKKSKRTVFFMKLGITAALILFLPFSLYVVAGLAFLDSGIDLRKRLRSLLSAYKEA